MSALARGTLTDEARTGKQLLQQSFVLLFRYMLVDSEEDKKTHRPVTPKDVRFFFIHHYIQFVISKVEYMVGISLSMMYIAYSLLIVIRGIL